MVTETLTQVEADRQSEPRERGIYEKVRGNGEWWVRHHDANGRLRREKAATLGMARKLYRKRGNGNRPASTGKRPFSRLPTGLALKASK